MMGWEKVKDTRLARKMFPNFKDSETDGYIMIPEPIDLSNTTFAERAHIAEQLLQYGLIKTKEEYMKIIDNIKQK